MTPVARPAAGLVLAWAPVRRPWPEAVMMRLLRQLPQAALRGLGEMQRWQDRQAHVLGRLLLAAILNRRHLAADLGSMRFSGVGRPFLPGAGDFSISHTDGLAACAWVGEGRVGLDVDRCRPGLVLSDLLPAMSARERAAIHAAPVALALPEALRLWTAKEAVCKADGCGVAVDALPECHPPDVLFRGRRWQVQSWTAGACSISIALPWMLGPPRLDIFRLRPTAGPAWG